MEVRSHEYIKVARSHDGRRSARHGRCACRHLQRRRRVFRLREHGDLDIDVQHVDCHTHADDDIHDTQYNDPACGREDRDDAAFGSASGEALVPGDGDGDGLRFER